MQDAFLNALSGAHCYTDDCESRRDHAVVHPPIGKSSSDYSASSSSMQLSVYDEVLYPQAIHHVTSTSPYLTTSRYDGEDDGEDFGDDDEHGFFDGNLEFDAN